LTYPNKSNKTLEEVIKENQRADENIGTNHYESILKQLYFT